jgi:bifunctional ADP-heptose synthase (sugar kinase/adenylyltransferase)
VNTLEKIKTLGDLRPSIENQSWTILAGCFDPLTAEGAKYVESHMLPGAKLLVVVESSAGELLDALSRAVLIAALRAVDAVMIENDSSWRQIVAGNPSIRVYEEGGEGSRRRAGFESLVLARHSVVSGENVG